MCNLHFGVSGGFFQGAKLRTLVYAIQTCSLTIYSQCFDCYGYVWVDGKSTGKYLNYNGMVQVTVPCGVVSVELRDEWGYVSDPRIIQTPQTSILIFDYFWN